MFRGVGRKLLMDTFGDSLRCVTAVASLCHCVIVSLCHCVIVSLCLCVIVSLCHVIYLCYAICVVCDVNDVWCMVCAISGV